MTKRCFLLAVVSVSCLSCQATTALPREEAASSPVALSTTPAPARAGMQDAAVFVFYFHRTVRCATCLLMEKTAAREIEEHFARQMRDGRVVWLPVNMEDPESEALRRQLNVQTNGVVLARMKDGVFKDVKNLDELWGLLGRPDAFSKYLIDEISARLSPVRAG
jgi:hypothetical protein